MKSIEQIFHPSSLAVASFVLFCAANLLVVPTMLRAQPATPATSSEAEQIDLEGMSKRTPIGAARGFMGAAEQGDYEAAAEFLDLRYLPDAVVKVGGARLAEQLYIVITRKLQIDFGSLSEDSEGLADDGLPSYRDLLGMIETERGKRSLYLQRVPGPGDSMVWKVSSATVARIPDLYEKFGYSPLVEMVRAHSPGGSFLGAEFFKWIIAVLFGFAAVILWWIVVWPLGLLLARVSEQNMQRVKRYLLRPVPAAIFVLVGSAVLSDLGLGLTAGRISQGKTVVTLVSVWLLFATVDLLLDLYAGYLRSRGRESGIMLLSPISSTSKILIAILALVVWLDNIGVNVTGLLAGLGIGGLAVALVLQRPLEDILGAMTLYMQQPVSVGQMCTSGDVTGTIESIGLRSTQIRKLNNHLVVIPNSVFATASIENVSARHRILHRQIIRLALDTSEGQIRAVLAGLDACLGDHPRIVPADSRVSFVGFGEFSIDLQMFVQVGTSDWREFLAIAQEINLSVIRVLDEAGVKLAVPPR